MSSVESASDSTLSAAASATASASPATLSASSGPKAESAGFLPVPAGLAVVVFLVGATAAHLYIHYTAHNVVNVHQAVLAFFLVLNVLINFWELGLFACGDQIHAEYEATKVSYKGREWDRVSEVFSRRIPFFKLLSFKEWTLIWSSYALYDPGYAQRHSFGFNIDVGNGFSTIIPATLFAFGMTYDIVSPQILGIIGVAMFWQMFYGTVVYFFQFFHSGRHHGHTAGSIWLFVGASNGMWFIFPIWGIAISVWMILNNSVTILH